MKSIIEIINELKARKAVLSNKNDVPTITEVVEIELALKTLEPYCRKSDFTLKEAEATFSGKIKDYGSAYTLAEGRYGYEFKIQTNDAKFVDIVISKRNMDIIINAMQNARNIIDASQEKEDE